jgi:hypothetical protein
MPRYKVALSHGWQIKSTAAASRGEGGVTASVLDTHWAHREVKRFRSENVNHFISGPANRHRETIRQAQEYCDRLNAEDVAA